jgi:hypothetical protein
MRKRKTISEMKEMIPELREYLLNQDNGLGLAFIREFLDTLDDILLLLKEIEIALEFCYNSGEIGDDKEYTLNYCLECLDGKK